jgi:hypothetical protein
LLDALTPGGVEETDERIEEALLVTSRSQPPPCGCFVKSNRPVPAF